MKTLLQNKTKQPSLELVRELGSVEVFVTKPDNLSSSAETHMTEGKGQLLNAVLHDLHMEMDTLLTI